MEHLTIIVGCWQIDELDLSLHSVYSLIVKCWHRTMPAISIASLEIIVSDSPQGNHVPLTVFCKFLFVDPIAVQE